jgi:hypothetical protein
MHQWELFKVPTCKPGISRLSERFNLRFQADMFNAFNRANFRAPDVAFGTLTATGGPSNGAFGKISTAGPARNIQFGLKLNF